MLGITHLFVGAATAVAVGMGTEDGIILAAAGALLPDIDHPNSLMGRWVNLGLPRGACLTGLAMVAAGLHWQVYWLSVIGVLVFIVGLLPHRSVTHSLLALLLVAYFMPQSVVVPLALGYASHLILDAFSGGVPLLWPWPRPIGYRIFFTGGPGEPVLGLFSLALMAGFWFLT